MITQVCWHCGTQYFDPVENCATCGASLQNTNNLIDTVPIDEAAPTDLTPLFQQKGTSILRDGYRLIFQLDGHQLYASLNDKVFVGRGSPQSNKVNYLDLDPFLAFDAGVSRRHAELRLNTSNQLVVVDLSSTNGSSINDQPLDPLHTYTVSDGDDLAFGTLVFAVVYEVNSK